MSNGWFSGRRRRPGHVDWGRHVEAEEERATQVLWGLVAINVVVFILWMQARGGMFELLMREHFLVSAEALANYRVWTLITSVFSHYDMGHLFFNMFGLWVFGSEVARAIGWRDLLNVYLIGGIIASASHVVFQLVTGDPSPALGASGAVMALAVMYGAMFPDRTLLVGFFLPLPAAVAVAGYILLDIFYMGAGSSNVAHAAHLGGAAYGLAFWWWKTQRPRPRR